MLNDQYKKTTLRLSGTILALVLLFPSAFKLSHIFLDHHHELCFDQSSTHFHVKDIKCDIYKFKLNNLIAFEPFNFEIIKTEHQPKKILFNYFFLSEHQSLHFSLRGPPSLS